LEIIKNQWSRIKMAYIFKSFVYLSSLKISLQKAVILMVWINNCILEFHCCSCFTHGSPVSWACFGYNSIYVATGLLSVFKSDSKTLGLQGAVRRLFAYRKCNFFFKENRFQTVWKSGSRRNKDKMIEKYKIGGIKRYFF